MDGNFTYISKSKHQGGGATWAGGLLSTWISLEHSQALCLGRNLEINLNFHCEIMTSTAFIQRMNPDEKCVLDLRFLQRTHTHTQPIIFSNNLLDIYWKQPQSPALSSRRQKAVFSSPAPKFPLRRCISTIIDSPLPQPSQQLSKVLTKERPFLTPFPGDARD